jgi:hypothetical protein
VSNLENKKDCIDPATTSAIGVFLFKSVAQAFVGWISLEFFKKYFNYFGNRQKNHADTDGKFPDKNPSE